MRGEAKCVKDREKKDERDLRMCQKRELKLHRRREEDGNRGDVYRMFGFRKHQGGTRF